MGLTVWTIRAATALYAASVALQVAGQRRYEVSARWMWVAGCCLYLAHVVCAFHFVHGWSHAAAYRNTMEQTAKLTGVPYGGGLYWNYVFTVIWVADAGWWGMNPDSYRVRPRWLDASVHSFLAFLFFNATVVFGNGPIRWAAIFVLAAFVVLWIRRRSECLDL